MSNADVEGAWEAIFDDLARLDSLDVTWLSIATTLLSFCRRFQPTAQAWEGLPAGEPWAAILAVEAQTTLELAAIDPDLFAPPADPDNADDSYVLSYPTSGHLAALKRRGAIELSNGPLADRNFSHVVVARGLAGAIDQLIGKAYVEWFKNRGETQLTSGQPYPVRTHDPRRWLGNHGANTNPAKRPSRDLSCTPHLRIADASNFNYVIDFEMWNRLSPIGSEDDLVIAIAQPNADLGEFDIRWHTDHPRTYANHGPRDRTVQTSRIKRLVEVASDHGAEIILLPEYTLSDDVRSDIEQHLSKASARPLVFCSGISSAADDGYVSNEAWLLAVTPGIERSYSPPRVAAKIYGATVAGFEERIRAASEVRVFMSENWTLAVLICRDAMDDVVLSQLSVIGTNLLLVPAMSQKTATIVGSISTISHKSQAFAAMANGPAAWTLPPAQRAVQDAQSDEEPHQSFGEPVGGDTAQGSASGERCEGCIAGPYASAPQVVELPVSGDDRVSSEPGLWLFRASDRSIKRLDC